MEVLKSYYFGFDLEEITKVQEYVVESYKEGVDFEMYIEMGDDCMNCLEVLTKELKKDSKFKSLVLDCEGKGKFNEDDY